MKPLQRHVAVDSFYHLALDPLKSRSCCGLACFAARGDDPARWALALAGESSLYCLGKCYAGPSDTTQETPPYIEVHSRRSVLLANLLAGGVHDFSSYCARGGGVALERARTMTPEDLVRLVEASGLRGRGGAGFSAGRKWQALARQSAAVKYLVVNADEGDPGAFSDRFLLEDDPFRLIEAAVIAAHGVGASHGYIYLRKEYPQAAQVLGTALAQARTAGWLNSVFDIELVVGKGSYLCGEETSLLNALEGRRPDARLRPPQITEQGLFGAPTLVQNVETLCALPWIVEHGAQAYSDLGFSSSRGTKLLSLNSLFQRPGLYEVEFGISLTEVVEQLGGGLRRGRLKGLMLGGPLAGIVPPHLLSTPLGYEELRAIGCAVGHGGVIAFADDSSILEIMAQVFRFGARESCGKCTPCRLGTPALATMFESAAQGGRLSRAHYTALVEALVAGSLCGHGRGLGEFARAVETHFFEELSACLEST